MKKLLLIMVAIAAMATNAFSQFTAQSQTTTITDKGISFLYLRDGLNSDFKAVSYDLYKIDGFGGRVAVTAIGAMGNGDNKVYAGTGLSLRVYESKGFSLKLIAGWKGFDLSNGASFTKGKDAMVLGIGVSIPLGK